jgi:hypothetical protein
MEGLCDLFQQPLSAARNTNLGSFFNESLNDRGSYASTPPFQVLPFLVISSTYLLTIISQQQAKARALCLFH